VRVRNIASGKVIRARITEDGNVQPADMPSTP
jgi:flagella basal body P-ring formation protein FlgA